MIDGKHRSRIGHRSLNGRHNLLQYGTALYRTGLVLVRSTPKGWGLVLTQHRTYTIPQKKAVRCSMPTKITRKSLFSQS